MHLLAKMSSALAVTRGALEEGRHELDEDEGSHGKRQHDDISKPGREGSVADPVKNSAVALHDIVKEVLKGLLGDDAGQHCAPILLTLGDQYGCFKYTDLAELHESTTYWARMGNDFPGAF